MSSMKAMHSRPQGKNISSKPEPLCKKCEKKTFRPEVEVTVDGITAHGLRDSGADNIYVKSHLVRQSDYTGKVTEVEMADFGFRAAYPTAVVQLSSPFVQGKFIAVVVDKMRPEVCIGNYAQRGDSKWIPVPIFPRRRLLGTVTTKTDAKKVPETRVAVPEIPDSGVTSRVGVQKQEVSTDQPSEISPATCVPHYRPIPTQQQPVPHAQQAFGKEYLEREVDYRRSRRRRRRKRRRSRLHREQLQPYPSDSSRKGECRS